MKKILVINGPNLNMLGVREPNIYGKKTLEDINEELYTRAKELDCEAEFFQSNEEGAIVSRIQEAYGKKDGIIINPGAYSHYSIAIADAIRAVGIKTIEVHISHIFKREDERKKLITAESADALICGFAGDSYILALEGLVKLL